MRLMPSCPECSCLKTATPRLTGTMMQSANIRQVSKKLTRLVGFMGLFVSFIWYQCSDWNYPDTIGKSSVDID